jgi:hypothetical protein
MANLLTDFTLTSAYTVTGTWADITGMSDTVTIAGTGSIVILMMSLNPEAPGTRETAEYRFTSGGSPVGPEASARSDEAAANLVDGVTLMFALTGLAAGSHTFAVQAQNRLNTAVIDTAYPRTFQVVEIESGATLLTDVSSSASDTVDTTWSDIIGLSDTKTPTSGSTLLFIATMNINDTGDDASNLHSFAIDGSRDGPEIMIFNDYSDGCSFGSFAWAETGVSAASHTFSLQWIESEANAATDADTARTRTLQVIEFTDDIDLLIDKESIAAHITPTTYADITDMDGSPDINSTDSVVLVIGCFTTANTTDDSADFRFSIGGTQEGAELTSMSDSATNDDTSGVMMARALTGESGTTTMALQSQDRIDGIVMSQTWPRTFQVLDLKTPEGAGITLMGAGIF